MEELHLSFTHNGMVLILLKIWVSHWSEHNLWVHSHLVIQVVQHMHNSHSHGSVFSVCISWHDFLSMRQSSGVWGSLNVLSIVFLIHCSPVTALCMTLSSHVLRDRLKQYNTAWPFRPSLVHRPTSCQYDKQFWSPQFTTRSTSWISTPRPRATVETTTLKTASYCCEIIEDALGLQHGGVAVEHFY